MGLKIISDLVPKTVTTNTYTVGAADHGRLIEFTNTACAVTVPQVNSSFPEGWQVTLRSKGSSVTVTPTTSTIDGASSLSLVDGQSTRIASDGTNYKSTGVGSGSTGITVGTTTITSGTDTRVLYNNAGVLGEYPVGTGVATALAVNVGSAGAFITFNGAGGTPSSMTLTNAMGLLPTGLTTFNNVNVIANGCFRVAQRGTSFTSTTTPANNDDTYLLDRWALLADGSDTVDVTQDTSDKPSGAYASIALDVETGNRKFGILQIIEAQDAARLFNGGSGTVSLSFWAKASSSIGTVKAAVLAWSSTADVVISDVVSSWNASGTTPTFAANWTAENAPVDLVVGTSWTECKIEGIALDTGSTANLAVFIWNDDATTTVGEFLRIANVQLQVGSKATEFEYRPYQQEFELCRRYCRVVASGSATDETGVGTGYNYATTAAIIFIPMSPPMRVIPTLTITANQWEIVSDTQDATSAITVIGAQSSPQLLALNAVSTGLPTGSACILRSDGDALRRLFLDAEL